MLLEREGLKVGVVPGLRQVQVRCKVGLGLWPGLMLGCETARLGAGI